jgi:hypothetical protein
MVSRILSDTCLQLHDNLLVQLQVVGGVMFLLFGAHSLYTGPE